MQDRRAVDVLLARLPADDPERATLHSRAAAYSTDCVMHGTPVASRTAGPATGTMGAAFLAAALLLAVVYFASAGGLGFRSGLTGLAFVLVAALAGKLAGLLLASLKLALLRRSLSRRLRSEGWSAHVHMH